MGDWIGGIAFGVMITCIAVSSKTSDRIEGINDPREKERLKTTVGVLNVVALFAFWIFLAGCFGSGGPHLSKADVM